MSEAEKEATGDTFFTSLGAVQVSGTAKVDDFNYDGMAEATTVGAPKDDKDDSGGSKDDSGGSKDDSGDDKGEGKGDSGDDKEDSTLKGASSSARASVLAIAAIFGLVVVLA